MTEPRFLQIHFLTSYPAALLNRDDVGFAKRIPFGGVTRTRISSQCLKRHWRKFDGENSLGTISMQGGPALMSVRSRLTFDRFIRIPLKDSGIAPELADAVTAALMKEVLGESAKAKREKEGEEEKPKKGKKTAGTAADEGPSLQTGQITVLGRPEIDFLLAEARAICAAESDPKKIDAAVKAHLTKERKENLKKCFAGLDAALFGRMVTSDFLARGNAAMHVAHAFTVHGEDAEADYFSAVDDLLQADEDLGSGHIGTTELTSGLFYGYVVVDLPLLVSNLEGCAQADWTKADRSLAAQVTERVIHLVAKVSPGAKLGSTAPYAYAHLVLAEAGNSQPRTLANAFLKPVSQRGDVVDATYRSLADHLAELDAAYGRTTERRLAGLGPKKILEGVVPRDQHLTIDELAGWLASQVGGKV